jgi:L-aspartate oxidase
MLERHPDAELAPRHVVTKAILDHPGGAWLDATHLPRAALEHEFPTVLAGAREYGWDLATQPVPVEPCEHYMVGGVATDLDGRTSVSGLWAAGETACTGVHGANRMAGNSLLQSCVFAHRAAASVAATLRTPRRPAPPRDAAPPPLTAADAPRDLDALRADLRRAMTADAGAIRTGEGLEKLLESIEAIAAALPAEPIASRAGLELANGVAVGRLIAGSALRRNESRGVHWRDDHPAADPQWAGLRLRVG